MNWRAFTATWTAITLAWWFYFAVHGEGPFVEIGRWRNARAAAKSLRLLNDCSSCANVCIAFSGLYPAARRRR